MKTYRLLHETPAHFVIHDLKDRKNFHVAKKGIDKNTSDTIKSLPPMNPDKASNYDNDMPDNREIVGTDSTPLKDQPQKLEKGGDVLDANARAHIAPSNFALPGNRYPIHNIEHARNALARVSQYGTPEEKEKVRAAVHSKYPSIGKSEGGKVEEMESHRHPLPDQKIPKEQDPGVQRDLGYGFGKGDQTVHHFDEGGSVLEEIGDSISKAFAKPTPTPPPAPTQEEKDEAIRHQNLVNAGEAPGTPTESQGGEIPHYADGTDNVQPPPDNYVMAAPPATAQVADAAVNSAMNALATPTSAPNNLPADFTKQVEDEKQRLALNAGVTPGTVKGDTPGALDQFQTQAETNIAQEYQQNQSAQQEAQKNSYLASVDKANADNAIRAKAGLALIPVPAPPTPVDTAPQQPGAIISQENQIPLTSPSNSQGMGLPIGNVAQQYQQGINQQNAGIQAGANAQASGANEAAQALQDNMIQQEAQQKLYEQENQDSQKHLDTLEQGAAQGKIDPNHYWNSKSTGGKISAAIGLIFGGIGAGLTHQPNAALEVIQKGIQRDIDAQVEDKSNKMSLYKIGLAKYQDSRAAQQFATLQANALMAGQLQQIAQKTGGQQAQATAQQMIGQLKAQSAPIKQQLDMQQAQLRMLNQGAPQREGTSAQPPGIDDNKLRIMINMGFIPKEEAASAMKEREDYQQLSGALDHTDQVFKQGLNLSNTTESALPGFVPSIRPSSREYEALRDSWLGNITKETEGRVTPQDIKLMEKSFPSFLDRSQPQVYQAKLNNIKDMIRSKYKFGTLPAYGLLNHNDPVTTQSSSTRKRFTPGAPVQ